MSSEAMKQMAPVIQGINSYRGTAIDNDKDYHKLVAKVRALAASAIHRAYIYMSRALSDSILRRCRSRCVPHTYRALCACVAQFNKIAKDKMKKDKKTGKEEIVR